METGSNWIKPDQTGSNWIKLAWKSHNKFGVSTARNQCDKMLLIHTGDSKKCHEKLVKYEGKIVGCIAL